MTPEDKADIRSQRLDICRDIYPHHIAVDECQPDGGHTECDACRFGGPGITIRDAPCLDCWNGGGNGDHCYWQPR